MSGVKSKLDKLIESGPAEIDEPTPKPKPAIMDLVTTAMMRRPAAGRPRGGSKIQEAMSTALSFADKGPDLNLIADLKLTSQQQLFVTHYLCNGFNASAAIREIYPGLKLAASFRRAHTVMRSPRVKEGIKRLINARCQDVVFTHNDVMRELALFNEADIYDYFETNDAGHLALRNPDKLTRLQKRNLKELTVRTTTRTDSEGKEIITSEVTSKIWDRQQNVYMIARILGMLDPTLTLDVSDNIAELMRRAKRQGVEMQSVTIDGTTGHVENEEQHQKENR